MHVQLISHDAQRLEERKALDVIPMGVGEEQVGDHTATLGHDGSSQWPKPAARIQNDQVACAI
jgi:hypothetical protein